MRVGIIVPQGWTGEYDGWDPARAWARTVAVAHQAEALGFESLWMFDHVQTEPVPTDEITFEAFVGLSALAAETARVRLGHLVLCAGYRNPALVAKMIATLDVVSGGRAVTFRTGGTSCYRVALSAISAQSRSSQRRPTQSTSRKPIDSCARSSRGSRTATPSGSLASPTSPTPG